MTGDDPMYRDAYRKPVQHYKNPYWGGMPGLPEYCVCSGTWPCEEIRAMWDDIDPPVTPRPKLSHPQLVATRPPFNGWYEYHYSVDPTEDPDEYDDEPLLEPELEPTNHHAKLADTLRALKLTRPVAPDHYAGKVEPYDYIAAHGLNYWEGNVVKYVTRAGRKHESPVDDYRKARNYLTYLIEEGQRNE